jgi:1-acyl-sn-glycerol-3-phosphate acyltransferase
MSMLSLAAHDAFRLARLPNGRPEGCGVDPFGYDAEFIRDNIAPALWMYRNYFRVQTSGIEHVPGGPVLLVANHSGQLPIDGLMIACALLLEAATPRFVRGMADRWLNTIPFISSLFARTGQLPGTPENCHALLDRGEPVLVFPEGARGICKPSSERYRLQRFGSGFMRIAASCGVPIVPVSVVGAEEQYYSIANAKPLARLLGWPAFPIMPQLLLPLIGGLPLPTRYRIRFGEPMRFGEDDADDTIAAQCDMVRDQIRKQLDIDLKRRRSVFQ